VQFFGQLYISLPSVFCRPKNLKLGKTWVLPATDAKLKIQGVLHIIIREGKSQVKNNRGAYYIEHLLNGIRFDLGDKSKRRGARTISTIMRIFKEEIGHCLRAKSAYIFCQNPKSSGGGFLEDAPYQYIQDASGVGKPSHMTAECIFELSMVYILVSIFWGSKVIFDLERIF
jgi:hypothetical protein